MSSPVNIVVPMAGRGSRFADAGYRDPKPLIDMFGKTMIEAVIENLKPSQPSKFIFICQREHYREYRLESLFRRRLGTDWDCVQLDGLTEGAACTVLAAEHLIAAAAAVVVANSDQIVDCSMTDFLEEAVRSEVDGLVMTFPATSTKWSYIRLNEAGFGVEIAEKRPISEHATVGIYHFASGKAFKDSARSMIAKNLRVNNEFYVAPIYNQLIEKNGKVGIWEIAAEAMHGIGTPEDLEAYFSFKGGYTSLSVPAR
ncbi:MAG: hypothetical protein AUJ52_02380 [Elusimicrobia bacterium CG1_02_63_36]|nr:MAG: hypothetical protein AUJ52_02380 [Elusimicrobia bacterium CG1_02_63_36]PIP84086.1 MAG: glycosyl transferase family 2 [Elusimicrobia bacterium CG22_combo_CG10-13_8_21_14_all_63_91]PJA15095.1 MAG: glycosyl transferase family 2 [Elusimicrobia bacterium CG_4_10_14_0_2_um_filter_63_34]PJB23503.1 MAG: glycosyl transferase family 2 [Elusimicrobia bacterium CG_4_9_14_3_um_filter_62_55]